MKLIPLASFKDNYIWLLHDGKHALVVDPGDAQVVLTALRKNRLKLAAILVTHHHTDHTGGVAELRQATQATVYGPRSEPVPEPFTRVSDGQTIKLLGLSFEVLEVPGHTAGHIAFFAQPKAQEALLFCGDTLFSAGCGRLFEGTPAQMLASLSRLAALPGATRVCCAHEYTASAVAFARLVEPDNQALRQYQQDVDALRVKQLPTLPSTIGLENQINPFLRTQRATVVAAVQRFDASAEGQVGIFAALRRWKDQF